MSRSLVLASLTLLAPPLAAGQEPRPAPAPVQSPVPAEQEAPRPAVRDSADRLEASLRRLEDVRRDLSRTRTGLAGRNGEFDEIRIARDRAAAELAEATGRLTTLEQSLREFQAFQAEVEQQRRLAEQQAAERREALAAARSEAAEQRARADGLEQRLAAALQAAEQARQQGLEQGRHAQREAVQRELAEARSDVAQLHREVAGELAAAAERNDRLAVEVESAREEARALREHLEVLRAERDVARAALDEAQAAAGQEARRPAPQDAAPAQRSPDATTTHSARDGAVNIVVNGGEVAITIQDGAATVQGAPATGAAAEELLDRRPPGQSPGRGGDTAPAGRRQIH